MFDFIRLVDQTITDPHITVVNKEFKIHHKKHDLHNKSKKTKEEDNMKIKDSSCLCPNERCKCLHSNEGHGCSQVCGCDSDCPINATCHEDQDQVKFCMAK